MENLILSSQLLIILGDFLTVYLYRYMHRAFNTSYAWLKERRWLYDLIYLLDYLLLAVANMMEKPQINFIASICCYFIPLFCCYKIKNFRGVIYFTYYMVGILVMEAVFGVGNGILQNGMGFQTDYNMVTPTMAVCANLVEIVMTFCLCHFGNKEESKYFDQEIFLFMVLPLVSVVLLIMNYILLALGLIEGFNQGQFIELGTVLLIINIVVFILMQKYTTVMKHEMFLTEEKLQLASDVRIMELASKSMRDKLLVSEQNLQQDRVMRHDRRHFESVLLSLLKEGNIEEAKTYLKERLEVEPKIKKKYCSNPTINAAICYYIAQAEKAGIAIDVSTNIPVSLNVDEMELAIVISNLIENAIHACEKLPIAERSIRIAALYKKQLLLTIENTYSGEITMDDEGYPCSKEKGHGIGTKSVQAFVQKTDSEIQYLTEKNLFIVRMII